MTTVAGPRCHFSTEIYAGAELRALSARPGAYDAMSLPSLVFGRRVTPGAAPSPVQTSRQHQAETLRQQPAAIAVATPYVPKPGSIPSQVLAHLNEHGGHLTYCDIKARFGVPQSSVSAIFKKALDSKTIVRCVIARRTAFALPGYIPPPDAPTPAKELQA